MPDRVIFDTVDAWKDRPDRPEAFTQKEWDRWGITGFSGVPYPEKLNAGGYSPIFWRVKSYRFRYSMTVELFDFSELSEPPGWTSQGEQIFTIEAKVENWVQRACQLADREENPVPPVHGTTISRERDLVKKIANWDWRFGVFEAEQVIVDTGQSPEDYDKLFEIIENTPGPYNPDTTWAWFLGQDIPILEGDGFLSGAPEKIDPATHIFGAGMVASYTYGTDPWFGEVHRSSSAGSSIGELKIKNWFGSDYTHILYAPQEQPPEQEFAGFFDWGIIKACDLELEILEYWPYAAKDGTPIYNTEDGERLQKPDN